MPTPFNLPSPLSLGQNVATRSATRDRYEATFVVSADPSKGDFTDLNTAISALPTSGGKIFVKAGVYAITSTIKITTSNVHIQGEGMGITVFVGSSAMTGNTPALQAFGTASDGTPRPLVADTARGDVAIRVSPADAASFNVGDFVLLGSNKGVDTESPDKHAGELKQLTAIDAASGVLTTDDQIFDAYRLSDAAQVVRVTVLQNITLSDLSVTTEAAFSNLRTGFTHFRFVENLQIERLEVHHAYFTGIHLQSVRNSAIVGCYIHHISDIQPVNPPNPANARYGIAVGCASQNVVISGCRFSHTRHAITTGGSSGPNSNGVQRNIVIANCTSMLSDTGHFDTHQPAENVTFIGCVADGGIPTTPDASNAIGFQMRGRNCSIIGCSVLQAIGRGVMIFGPNSSGSVISGNMIANVKALTGNKAGTGIFFDSAGTSNHAVSGNVIKNCDGSAIGNGGGNNDIVITGNVIQNVNTLVPGAAIQLTNAARTLISGNNINISASASNHAITMLGTSDDWRILGNHFTDASGGSVVSLAGTGAVVVNNFGYNPVGSILNPWPTKDHNLTNSVSAGTAGPASGVTYRVSHSPKTIIITGGDVTQIAVNGMALGATAGVYKLGVGETIAVTYGTLTPNTRVFAE